MVDDVDATLESGGTTTIEGEDGGGRPLLLLGPLQLTCEGRVELVDAGENACGCFFAQSTVFVHCLHLVCGSG